MKRLKVRQSLLTLETLEDRTLLAGMIDEAEYSAAFDVVGRDSVGFSFRPPVLDSMDDEVAEWVGQGDAELTVYVDRLPEAIDTLSFSGFSAVRVIGEGDLNIVSAENVDVLDLDADFAKGEGGLHTDNVDSIIFGGAVPAFMLLQGDEIAVEIEKEFDGSLTSLVRANALDVLVRNPIGPSDVGLQLTQLPDADGGPLVLSLINVDQTNLSLSGTIVDADDVALGVEEELSEESLNRILEALGFLAESEILFDDGEYESLRTAVLELANVQGELSDDSLGDAESILLMALNADGQEKSGLFSYSDGSAEKLRHSIQDDLTVLPSQQGLELKETETGLKVFVLQDSERQDVSQLSLDETVLDFVLDDGAVSLNENASAGETLKPSSSTVNVIEGLVALLSRTQSAGEALRTHLLDQLSAEVTPGAQVGLVVDGARGAVRKDFIQRGS